MMPLPPALKVLFDAFLLEKATPPRSHPAYHKWWRYDWDFCRKYHFSSSDKSGHPPFSQKLKQRNQSIPQQREASHAVSLFHDRESISSDDYKISFNNKPLLDEDVNPGGEGFGVSGTHARALVRLRLTGQRLGIVRRNR
jgi:hypothetical protein